MKRKLFLLLGVIGLFIFLFFYLRSDNNLSQYETRLINYEKYQNGDLIFQTSKSDQSAAIQLATKSKYSHCGIIYKVGHDYYVFEAVKTVKLTPLGEWIDRGKNRYFVVKRLKNAAQILTSKSIKKMKNEGQQFKNKKYDYTFEWSDDKIYCSELIWKIYKRAVGIEIGKLEKLGDFDLTNKKVMQILKDRYKNKIPLNETVISTEAIFDCKLLYTVASN
jgi:hypothetical protein